MKEAKNEAVLQDYAVPRPGEVIFACKRCQKKLRDRNHASPIARFRKWLKKRNRESRAALHLIEIPCQKICPKKGVVAFGRAQLANARPRFVIVSSEKQLERFCEIATNFIDPAKTG